MTAHKVDLAVDQGGTFDKTWIWKSGGAPVNLTGCTARSQVRASVSSPAVGFSMTTVNGRIVLGGTAGTIRILLTDEETASLKSGVYDLYIDFPDGTAARRMEGRLNVTPGVTRA